MKPNRLIVDERQFTPMKIVQIITLGEPIGGAQKHVIDLCTRLKAQGHEVLVLIGNGEEFAAQFAAQGIRCEILKHLKRSIRPIQDFLCYREIKKRLIEASPDIVAAHSSKAGMISRLVCRSLNIPNTFTVHGWSFAEGIPFLQRMLFILIERIIGKVSNQFITVAEADRELGLKYKIVPHQKIKTIHNGVLPPNIAITPRKSSENGLLKLIMVARFEAQKDHATLIESLSQLKQLKWELTLLGNGPKETEIKNLVADRGLSDRVFFRGAVNNVYDYLEHSDLSLLISKWEGFPLTILEAMGHGIPVIASDVGGVKEAIQDGVNGFLIERGNVQQLKEKILQVGSDAKLRENMGQHSLLMYQKDFTLERMVEKTVELYRQLAENQNG